MSGAGAQHGYARDPAAQIEEAFRAILAERVADIPLLNPAIEVEAVGFERTSAGWLGVLVTPWFMNVMLLPAAGDPWRTLAVGEKRRIALPAGVFEFFGGAEERIGEYMYCSMFSPMDRFADHAGARATALELCRMLFDAQTEQRVQRMNPSGLGWFEPPAGPDRASATAGRRRFLRGRS